MPSYEIDSSKYFDEAERLSKLSFGIYERRPTLPVDLSDEECFNTLNKISSPTERLVLLAKSVVGINQAPTYEGDQIRSAMMIAFGAGMITAGFLSSSDYHKEYQRKYNAAVFEGKHISQRRYFDTLFLNVVSRGFSTAIRASLLTGSALFIGHGSATVRGYVSASDYLIGGSVLGALSRTWLGPNKMLAGAFFGLLGGTICWGVIKGATTLSDISIPQIAYESHMEHVHKHREEHRRRAIAAEEKYADPNAMHDMPDMSGLLD